MNLTDPVGGMETEINADPGQNSLINGPQFIPDSRSMGGGRSNLGPGIEN